ncbi:MAG: serine/threonine-protein kinase [Pirellulaceae bacterium]|nr:serine/threonine-protein kinase [Pirellulaceae bacterium]MDG2105605.1 serine/threonine-protein kinase [Pirellulaceae bacterium]
MSIFDKFKNMLSGSGGSQRLDVTARFELERHAFSGTMSKFRVAREITTNRRMGLKLLDAEKLQQFNDRFKGLKKPPEGEIGLSIRHPQVVETFEYGKTTTGQDFILMEYVHGPGLSSVINDATRREQVKPHRLKFIRQMCEGIQATHEAGFIHRDICPRNFIMHHDMEYVKLIDFGLSLPDEDEYKMPGNRTGTPQYMAPEIVRRRHTDSRVDLFALGVSCYRLLTSEHPWGSVDTTGLAALVHDQKPHKDILELRPRLNRKLAKIINQCLAPKADDRPDSAEMILRFIRDVDFEEQE